MKYIIAISVVCLIFGLALRLITETRREVREVFREAFQSPEVQAQLSEEEQQSMSEGNLDGLGTELPALLVMRIQRCDLLKNFWFIWIPLTLGLGLAIINFWPMTSGELSGDPSPANSTSTSMKQDG